MVDRIKAQGSDQAQIISDIGKTGVRTWGEHITDGGLKCWHTRIGVAGETCGTAPDRHCNPAD